MQLATIKLGIERYVESHREYLIGVVEKLKQKVKGNAEQNKEAVQALESLE